MDYHFPILWTDRHHNGIEREIVTNVQADRHSYLDIHMTAFGLHIPDE